MPDLELVDCRIRYNHYQGGGTTVVFIHGYGGRREDWQQQITALAPAFSVLALDNRGHGSSTITSKNATCSVPDMVSDLNSLLDHLEIDRFHLVGHSIGGAVAQEVARARPGDVASLTLVATTDWFGDHDQPGGEPPYIPEALRERSRKRAIETGAEVLRLAWSGLIAWRGSQEWIDTLACRTLVLLGSRDASRIREGSQRLADAIGNSKLVYLDNVGHSPHLESAEEFNKTLIDFLIACDADL